MADNSQEREMLNLIGGLVAPLIRGPGHTLGDASAVGRACLITAVNIFKVTNGGARGAAAILYAAADFLAGEAQENRA